MARQPYIAKIDFKFYPDFPSMLAAYRAGEIQGLNKVPADQLTTVRDTPSMNLYTGPMAGYTMIFLNQGDAALPFFQDQNVRQALLLSLDRRQIVEEVLHGQGIIADSPIIPGTWAYAADLPPVVPNRDRARQLLNEAGWRYPVAQQAQPPARDKGDDSLDTAYPRGRSQQYADSCEGWRADLLHAVHQQQSAAGGTGQGGGETVAGDRRTGQCRAGAGRLAQQLSGAAQLSGRVDRCAAAQRSRSLSVLA